MPYKDCVKPLILKDLDASAIAPASWSVFDLNGTEEACFMIRLTNNSNRTIFISFNGTDVAEILLLSEDIIFNFQANSCPNNHKSQFKKYSKVYIRGVAGIGKIYLSGYYNEPCL